MTKGGKREILINFFRNKNVINCKNERRFYMRKLLKMFGVVMLSLAICLTAGVNASASEVPIKGTIEKNTSGFENETKGKNLSVVPRNDADNADEQLRNGYDAQAHIVRSNPNSGVFYGNYYYTINDPNVSTLYLNVYMPANDNMDFVQGTITLFGNDGSSASVQIANFVSDSWTLTFSGVQPGVSYYFYYQLHAIGTSNEGYIWSYAFA